MANLQAVSDEIDRCEREHNLIISSSDCFISSELDVRAGVGCMKSDADITNDLISLIWMDNVSARALKGVSLDFIGGVEEDNSAVKLSGVKRRIVRWKIMMDWYRNLDPLFSIDRYDAGTGIGGIAVQSFDVFNGNLGFVKFKVAIKAPDARNPGSKMNVPGIIFMRSPSVAILPVFSVEGDDDKYTLITVQARAPVGIARFQEIPAGMMDGANKFVGVAIKEFKEEIGIDVDPAEMVCLTDFAFKGLHAGMYPSAGGCNEFLKIFMWRKLFTSAEFNALKNKVTATVNGEEKEGEQIKVRVIRLEDLHWEAPDAKALSALALYMKYKERCFCR